MFLRLPQFAVGLSTKQSSGDLGFGGGDGQGGVKARIATMLSAVRMLLRGSYSSAVAVSHF